MGTELVVGGIGEKKTIRQAVKRDMMAHRVIYFWNSTVLAVVLPVLGARQLAIEFLQLRRTKIIRREFCKRFYVLGRRGSRRTV